MRTWRRTTAGFVVSIALVCAVPQPAQASPGEIAVIGDFGDRSANEAAVARLVLGRKPVAIVTTGDNIYRSRDYAASVTRYYPRSTPMIAATGNHDYSDAGIGAFRAAFGSPERAVTVGDVEFIVVDSQAALDDPASMARQRDWVRQRATNSTAAWQVVVLHHPPYSSGPHGSSRAFRWPFADWGVDLVLSGHDHDYERLLRQGATYVVDGAGGARLYRMGRPLAGSVARDDRSFGALFLSSSASALNGEFRTTDGRIVDRFAVRKN